jgi:hypothetical protein
MDQTPEPLAMLDLNCFAAADADALRLPAASRGGGESVQSETMERIYLHFAASAP